MNKGHGVIASVGSARVYDYGTIASVKDEELPSIYQVKYIPVVLDQGTVNSCVAHGIAENLQANHLKKAGELLDLSVLEIYGLWRGSFTGEGMYVESAIKRGMDIGTMPREFAPENVEVPDAISMAKGYAEEYPKALAFKVGSYFRIRRDENFEINIKKALMQFEVPVLTVLDMGGKHCEIVIGWDEEGFILQNSWGEAFGDKGTHHKTADKLEEAYVVTMEKVKLPFKDVEGHWAEKNIRNLYFANILSGRTEDSFEPEGYIKRGEVAKMLDMVMKANEEKMKELEEKLRKGEL